MPFTEPTTGYWQRLLPSDEVLLAQHLPPWQYRYPARLPDGRVLMLPVRPLAARPEHAVASLLCNQASFEVLDVLGALLAEQLRTLLPSVIVGLPTLGLGLAASVAQHLGHSRCVPMGYSRKFWYDDALSAQVRSITSPGLAKRVYLDPQLLPLLKDQRVVLIDDVISTGQTALAPWQMLEGLGVNVVAMGLAMRQGQGWQAHLGADRAARVLGVLDSPLLQATQGGWVARDVTANADSAPILSAP